MAGATKQEFANWTDPATTEPTPNPWNRTPTQPLDDMFGAGELNVYNSYLIQLGGQHAGQRRGAVRAAVASMAGIIRTVRRTRRRRHVLQLRIARGQHGDRAVDHPGLECEDHRYAIRRPAMFTPSESLQNLDLQFYNSTR